ncbi:uncharacterized protein Dana_GF26948, isoform B [Drosophila ananassae]|nr:uncharacterized protein LOC26514357 isoform X1 [Drosophila ananassae]KPU79705.1 uncharacterized protein Dana_GF26948, isoform B [Drosophila ananassae]
MEFALNLKMFENDNFSHAFKVWMDKRKLDLEEGKVNMSSNLNFIIEGDEPLKKAKRVYRTKYVHQWKEVVHIDGNGTKWVNEKLQCPLCFLACASQRQYSKCSVTPKTHSCPYCPFIKALPNLGQHQKCRCKGRKDTLYKAVGEMLHLRQRWNSQKNERRALEDTAEDDLYEVSEEMLDNIFAPEPVEGAPPFKKPRIYRTFVEHEWKEVAHVDSTGKEWKNAHLQCPLCFAECGTRRKFSAHYSMCVDTPKIYGCPYCPYIKALPNLGQHLKFRCKGKNEFYKAVGEMAELRQRWINKKNQEREKNTVEEMDNSIEASEEMLDGIFLLD